MHCLEGGGGGCDDMATSDAQCAEAILGVANAWDTAMLLWLLHELMKNNRVPDLRVAGVHVAYQPPRQGNMI